MNVARENKALFRTGLIGLLEINDSDIRILTLGQARDASDKGIHIGGAMSDVILLVALRNGGRMRYDVADPSRIGQDFFVLSKGHAVAALASVHADLGYFPASVLKHSRSPESLLKGHPGPFQVHAGAEASSQEGDPAFDRDGSSAGMESISRGGRSNRRAAQKVAPSTTRWARILRVNSSQSMTQAIGGNPDDTAVLGSYTP